MDFHNSTKWICTCAEAMAANGMGKRSAKVASVNYYSMQGKDGSIFLNR